MHSRRYLVVGVSRQPADAIIKGAVIIDMTDNSIVRSGLSESDANRIADEKSKNAET